MFWTESYFESRYLSELIPLILVIIALIVIGFVAFINIVIKKFHKWLEKRTTFLLENDKEDENE
ncbi:MAG: hypothetical protein J6V44_05990 [Methanobrevibacter sp.]|nr:hypothetical protein [Methanobrevibacter sp.]MBO7692802.1 hypothetical protein [Methanobrevibacter sp.]